MLTSAKRQLPSVPHKRILVAFDRTMLFPCRVLTTFESAAILDRIFLEEGTQAPCYSDRLSHRFPLPCIFPPTHTLNIFTDCDLSLVEATHTFHAILFSGGREAKVQGMSASEDGKKEFRRIC